MTKEYITTIVPYPVEEIANLLVEMNKAFNSPSYCEGINKYNVRSVYKYWAERIVALL